MYYAKGNTKLVSFSRYYTKKQFSRSIFYQQCHVPSTAEIEQCEEIKFKWSLLSCIIPQVSGERLVSVFPEKMPETELQLEIIKQICFISSWDTREDTSS